jgi:hypothetical protein
MHQIAALGAGAYFGGQTDRHASICGHLYRAIEDALIPRRWPSNFGHL